MEQRIRDNNEQYWEDSKGAAKGSKRWEYSVLLVERLCCTRGYKMGKLGVVG